MKRQRYKVVRKAKKKPNKRTWIGFYNILDNDEYRNLFLKKWLCPKSS
jgi:hypothetical protein